MLDKDQLDPASFLARQLHSAVISTKGKIVIGGIITTITRFLGVEPNPKDGVSGSERLDQAAFEILNFCKVYASRLCWIYPRDWLSHFPMSIVLLYFTEVTFTWYLVMIRSFNPYPTNLPLSLVKQDLVLPLNFHHLTIVISKTPLGLF